MILEHPRDLRGHLSPGRRLMGLDPGSKTWGLALSDVSWMLATPLTTLGRRKYGQDVRVLADLIREHDVAGLVVGLPLEMDGTEGRRCQSVRDLAANLDRDLGLPIAFWDERLSTSAVEKFLIGEADLSRGKRARAIDRAAAAYILQGALDSLG